MGARRYTRVAAVQIACHPAIALDGWSPLEDPLFDGGPRSSLRLEGRSPPALDDQMTKLRERVRTVYTDQLGRRVRAILSWCRSLGVRVVVFPEYAIPWTLLDAIVESSGEMVVVAGTHTVDRAARRAGVYERLGAPQPQLLHAVCPVIYRGQLLALQPKLSPAVGELGQMKPGTAWQPVQLPEGLPGPMGVLVCKDFLHREGEAHHALVARQLEACRFLAVPSLTPGHSIPEFASKAWEEARRYGRPVLYADTAEGGGTSIFVDEGRPGELRRFPDHAGVLESGDEGVIVADVDLGFVRTGGSTRYDQERPIFPVAAASLLYHAHPIASAHAAWLADIAPLLERDDDEAVEELAARVTAARDPLLNVASLPAAGAREARLRRLLRDLDHLGSVESFRRYLREVELPPEVLPLTGLRAAMAAGAAETIFEWQKEFRGAGLEAVREHLERAGRAAADLDRAEWTEAGRKAIAAASRAVMGEPPAVKSAGAGGEVVVRAVLPAEIDPAILGERRRDGFVFWFRATPDDLWRGELGGRLDPERGKGDRTPSAARALLTRVELGFNHFWRLHLLSLAEGAERASVVCVAIDGAARPSWLGSLSFTAGTWVIRLRPEAKPVSPVERGAPGRFVQALEQEGFLPLRLEVITDEQLAAREVALVDRFSGARDEIYELRRLRLLDVNGAFVEPTARTAEGDQPALAALDGWLAAGQEAALLLGEFGSGKSTVLAEWCHRRWESSEAGVPPAPRPILCNLAAAAVTDDEEWLLLRAARLPDETRHRAALRLLVRMGHLLPCFDGLDEMATRVAGGELAGRLTRLLGIARDGGRVLVSSRDHYFETENALQSITAEALREALGVFAHLARLTLLPFTDAQVHALVEKVLAGTTRASEALQRIASTYDLNDLVHRPLLLAMVLGSIDRIDPRARVAPSDVYELYLQRWLEHTREERVGLSHEQKVRFAEALAEELWRSGSPSCTWEALRASVRERVNPVLPDHVPPGAAFADIQGGAFFVRDGEDRYRFAHKSFLEYFLARALVATLETQPRAALTTHPITAEVAGFVGEILRARGAVSEAPVVRAVQRYLAGARWLGDVQVEDRQGIAAANVLRLLLHLGGSAGGGAGLVPDGADLHGVDLRGEDLRGVRLRRARLDAANLAGCDLTEADLTGADLRGARLSSARLDRATLAGVDACRASFVLAEADGCVLTDARLEEACLRQSTWVGATAERVHLAGAEVTGWICAPAFPDVVQPATAVSTLAAVLATGHTARVLSVAFSPDGSRIASGGADFTVRLWDADSGGERAQLRGHTDWVRSVAFSPEGTRIASGGDDGTVRLWDADSGSERAQLRGHADSIWSVAFSRDGTRIVSGGDDGTVRLWDAASGGERAQLRGHTDRVWSVAFSRDGTCIASGGDDGTVRLWDAASGGERAQLRGHTARVSSVAFSPDGTCIASSGADGTVRLWDAASGGERAQLRGHTARVLSVAFSPDGTRIASGGADGTVRLWDADSGGERAQLRGHTLSVRSVAFSPDGTRIASGGADGTVRLWDVASGGERTQLRGHTTSVRSMAFSPDGTRIVSGGADGTVRLWDAASGGERAELRGHTASVRSVAFSHDGARIASGGDDGTVRLWETASGGERAELRGHTASVRSVAFSRDGTRIVSGGDDGTVRLWDAASGGERAELRGHTARVWSVAFSRDGTRIASSGDDGTVRLWDAESGSERAQLRGHTASVWSVAFSRDGTRIASGGADSTVRLWDAESGGERAQLRGHTASVRSVAFSRDGTRIASGGDDGTVRLWETESGGERAQLRGHMDWVWSVAFSPDGTRIASGGTDGIIRLWDVDRARLLCTLQFAGETALARTPGGFCRFGGGEPDRYRLAVTRPDGSGTVLYLPLGGLRAALDRPDKVIAALAGDLSGDDVRPALAALGGDGGVPWDGEAHRVAGPVAPPDPAASAPVSPAAATRVRIRTSPFSVVGPSMVSAERAATRARNRPTPFRPGPALLDADELPGRGPALHELRSLIDSRSPAILIGPRRSGKTSLLATLRRHLGDARPVRSITLELVHPRTADELARVLEPELDEVQPAGDRFVMHVGNTAPIYLIDEVAHLSDAERDLFPWLRAVGQRVGPIVLAGSLWDWNRVVRRANEVSPGSSFGNDVTPVVLGPIPEEESMRFFADLAPDEVPPTVARWIVETCGPWPFYLQVMGHALFEAWHLERRAYLSSHAAFIDVYEQRLLVDRGTAVFESRVRELPATVRALLATHPDTRPIFRDLPLELRNLVVDCGLCSITGAWLEDKPFFDWIRRNPTTTAGG